MTSGWATAESIDDVLERMETISRTLPAADGVATFNRMYGEVTRLVDGAVDANTFRAGPFLAQLDVHFANLFFEAYEADLNGREVPLAWQPLFEARSKPDTHPLQFALAGMNAHISHDLPCAVVVTCQELGKEPEDDSDEHADYTQVNSVLEAAQEEIKTWFSSGIVATLDRAGGKIDDGFAAFGIHVARAIAWQSGQMLYRLSDNPRMNHMMRTNLGRSVALASRGILI